jgi:hypothetical protein
MVLKPAQRVLTSMATLAVCWMSSTLSTHVSSLKKQKRASRLSEQSSRRKNAKLLRPTVRKRRRAVSVNLVRLSVAPKTPSVSLVLTNQLRKPHARLGGRGGADTRVGQAANQQARAANQRQHAANAPKDHRHQPGDMIATGTPKGLSDVVPGDEVVVEVEGVGRLVNRIVSEDTAK